MRVRVISVVICVVISVLVVLLLVLLDPVMLISELPEVEPLDVASFEMSENDDIASLIAEDGSEDFDDFPDWSDDLDDRSLADFPDSDA